MSDLILQMYKISTESNHPIPLDFMEYSLLYETPTGVKLRTNVNLDDAISVEIKRGVLVFDKEKIFGSVYEAYANYNPQGVEYI